MLNDPTSPVLRYLGNSALIVFSIVVFGIFVRFACSLRAGAYPLSRPQLHRDGGDLADHHPDRGALAVPMLLMMNEMGWVDTFKAQIMPFIAHPFSIFLFYQFFAKIPKDYDETAYLDAVLTHLRSTGRSSCRCRCPRSRRWRSCRASNTGTRSCGP